MSFTVKFEHGWEKWSTCWKMRMHFGMSQMTQFLALAVGEVMDPLRWSEWRRESATEWSSPGRPRQLGGSRSTCSGAAAFP